MFSAWSYSRLQIFEKCKLHAKLAFIDRIPEPPRPLPPGKTEHANDRGSRIHEAAELYVRGGVEIISELASFAQEFNALRNLHASGRVSLEGEWAVDRDWMPVSWTSSNAWARIKLDAMVLLSQEQGVVIDYKTGKRAGNEIKHLEQGQLYQLAAFMRYPELEKVDVEFWYTDQDEIHRISYTRRQGLRYLAAFSERGNAMVTASEFPSSPSIFNCKWCPYGPTGTGHCPDGLQGSSAKQPKSTFVARNTFVSWP